MTLPLSRNTTYANGAPVEADALNDFQDAVIGHKSGPRTDFFPAGAGVNTYASAWAGATTHCDVASTSSSQDLYHPIRLPIGAIITAILVWVDPAGAGAIQAIMGETIISTGVSGFDGRAAVSSSGTAHQSISLIEDLPFTLTDLTVDIYMSSAASGDVYIGSSITWYMP